MFHILTFRVFTGLLGVIFSFKSGYYSTRYFLPFAYVTGTFFVPFFPGKIQLNPLLSTSKELEYFDWEFKSINLNVGI